MVNVLVEPAQLLDAAQALAGGEVRTETFTVTLNDGSTTTVTITATGTDDTPVISSGTGSVTEDTSPTASSPPRSTVPPRASTPSASRAARARSR